MNRTQKYRHPMFLLVLGALFLYEVWTLIRIVRTYLGFDSNWYAIPSNVQTALIIGIAASLITILGLIALFLLRRLGLLILGIGILLSLYPVIGPNLGLGSRVIPSLEALVKFLAVWFAVKAGPDHEEAIGQLE